MSLHSLSLAIESSVPSLISVFIAPPHLLATVLALWFCCRDYSHVLRSKRHVEERKLKGKNEKQKRGLHSFGIKDEKQVCFFLFFFLICRYFVMEYFCLMDWNRVGTR